MAPNQKKKKKQWEYQLDLIVLCDHGLDRFCVFQDYRELADAQLLCLSVEA